MKYINFKILFVFLLFCLTLSLSKSYAATCSCAGVSLSNSVNLSQFSAEQWQVSINFTKIDISDLVAGSRQITDQTGRFRKTDSLILQTTYGFNEHWAITGIVSQIEHQRNNQSANSVLEKSSGIGDSMLLLSYSPQKLSPFNKNEFAFGIATRLATGKNNQGSPIVFSEDMQPGEGAQGQSLWFHYARSFNQQADLQFYFNANYSHMGTNNRKYSFENEWSLSSGVYYQYSDSWSTSGGLKYRQADRHTRFGFDIPNTGGQWIDLELSFNFPINQQTSLSFSTIQPVSRNLNDALQFTTKNSYSVGISYLFD